LGSILPVSSSRFLHFPTIDGCNAKLNSPIVICCCIFNVILTNDWSVNISVNVTDNSDHDVIINNWWALLALALVLGTAAGNILVCLAITWERRLQNVTNYFLMSLAITDLMVAVLVMPLGILTLVRGKFH
ncbi:hypothetical protein L9F63_008812, partial [Diploptera punctata]